MKNHPLGVFPGINPFHPKTIILSAFILAGSLGVSGTQINIYKANSPTLNSAVADWTTTAGGATYVAPAAGEIGAFDSTILAGNAAALTLGGNVTLDQLVFSANAPTVVIGATTGSALTLGTASGNSGINLAAATHNDTLNCDVVLAANQTWTVKSGLILTNGGGLFSSGSAGLAVSGGGTIVLAGSTNLLASITCSSGNGTSLILAGTGAGNIVTNQINSLSGLATLIVNSGTWIFLNGRTCNATNLTINNGGTLQIGTTSTNGNRLSLDMDGQQLTIHTGGFLNVTNSQFGLRLGNDNGAQYGGNVNFTGVQDGGTVYVYGSGAGIDLGGTTTGKTAAYTLSGGLMTIATNGAGGLNIGAGTNGNGTSTFALTRTGKLFCPFNIQGSIINDPTAQQVFAFTGGTLVARTYMATYLRDNATDVDGTLVNGGGTLAPGDLGTPGKTIITGNYAVSNSAATLAIDLGGTTQANAFQSGPTNYDFVSVSGTAVLDGNLGVNFVNGFVPAATDSFTILTAAGGVSGAFTNLAYNFVPVTNYPGGYFQVVTTATSVILTNFGTPSLSPVLTVASTPFYFTTLATGLTETATITLNNSGLAMLTGYVSLAGAPFAIVGGTNFVLAGGASTNLTVSFTPSTNTTYTGSLTFISNGGNATNFIYGSGFIPVSTGFALVQSGQTVVDAGTTYTFTVPNVATNYAWRMEGTLVSTNGIVGTNGPAFTYAPMWYDVGTHYLVCYQTLPGGQLTNNYWQVRVRIPLPASAVALFVATNGSDANPGTLALPLQTLEAARNAVRNLQPLPAGGVTVWLRGGTYFRTNTFLLASNDSGTLSAPVMYRGYPGETAVISAGKPILASAFMPLATSETNRVAPGVNPTNILELDVTAQGIIHTTNFPAHFNQWTTANVYNSGFDGGLCELFYNGKRMWLSRYPKHDLINDNLNTDSLLMNGVATGGTGSTNYLNSPGTYTNSAGVPVPVGCAFHYYSSNATEIARWQTALTHGGLWVAGAWRVPWQIDSIQVLGIDTTNRVIEITNTLSVQGGIGDKYTRPAGNHAELWWTMNLLEELTQPGEWAVDFNRGKIYFLPPGPVTDGSVVISDLAAPMVQLAQTTNVIFQSLTFEAGLAQGILVTNGVNNLVAGCTFRNLNNYPVDLNGGYTNGVVSCLLRDLGGGGVLLHGGNASSVPRVPARHFVVNNIITNCAVIGRVYATPVDVGGNGEGIQSTNCVGMRIAHNLLTVAPETGILHGYTWDASIEYNDQGNYGQTYGGIGGIYGYTYFASSGNNNFRYNFLHDSPLVDGITFDQDHRQAHVYCNVVNLNPPAIVSLHQCFGTETGSQATPGEQQYLDHYNNLGVNANHGFDVVAPTNSLIEENAMINCLQPYSWQQVVLGVSTNTFSPASPTTNSTSQTALQLQSGPNMAYASDPGFVDLTNNDLRLLPTSPVYTDMPKFTQIPFELIGLYNDEIWTNARSFGPCILNQPATGMGARTATVNGLLAYPQFGSNTSVIVYWGNADGATNPAAWQNAFNLGTWPAGGISFNLSGLAAGTNNYYRFYATNAGGSYWSPATTSFATPLDLSGFGSRQLITLTGYTAGETLTNFPVLVRLGTNLPGFSYRQFASPTGGDLRFVDSSEASYLKHEVERWNTNGLSYVWVQLPQLSAVNNSFWAVWGNPAATNPPAYTTNGAAWDTNFISVWHLNQAPPAKSLDSTANTNLATPAANMGSTNQVAGTAGGSLLFNTNWLNVPDSLPLRLTNTGQFTLSAWVNLNSSSQGVILGKGQNGSKYYSWFLTVGNNVGVDNNNATHRLCVGFRTSNLANDTQVSQTSDVTLSNWVYVAGTLDDSNLTLYVNGQLNNVTNTTSSPYGINNQLWIGADSGRDYLSGQLDEVRVENIARSSNWVWASYLTTASNAVFANYAPVSRPQPTLALGGGAGRLFFNWPGNGVGYALYVRTNLVAGSDWTLATNQPALVSSNGILQWQISIPFGTNTASYYRLKEQ